MAAPVIPETQAISDAIVAQIETSISQTVPILPKAFSRVVAKALAGATIILYKYAGFIFLQLFVRYATMEPTTVNGKVIRPLLEWGRLIGCPDPTPATRGEFTVSVPVNSQTGSLAAGTQLVRTETGAIYTTVAAVALSASTITATIRATPEWAGAVGNLIPGDKVKFANTPPNVASEVTVATQVTAGVDAETTEAYRARVFRKYQARPQGGAYADYREWAETVAGIINAYPYTSDNPGEVDIYCEASEASSGSVDGIPTGGQLTAVFDAINLDVGGKATRRPANAAINVLTITRTAFDVEFTGLEATADQDLDGLKSAIESGLDEYLRYREPYIEGLHVLPRRDRITEPAIGGVVDSIVNARGGIVTTVRLKQGADYVPAYTLEFGEKAKLGSASYL